MVYFSLIYPYLHYSALTWGNTYKSRLNQLNVLNNKAIRIMTFSDYRTHAPPLFKYLGILQFQDIVYTQIAIFMYDFHNNLLPAPFSNYFKKLSDVHSYHTRHSTLNYYLPSISTNYGKSSLKFSGISIWNDIDIKLKNLNRATFIKTVKQICFQKYL